MIETGRMGNNYGIDNVTISQHEMENQMHHRAYGKKSETFAAYARLGPTNYNVNHDQEADGGAMVPETLADDQESRFRITRDHGLNELMNEIDLWVGKIHIVALMATFWPGRDTTPSMHAQEYVVVPESRIAI